MSHLLELTINVTDSNDIAQFNYTEPQAKLVIGQRVILTNFTEAAYDDVEAFVVTVGAGFFTTSADFVGTATGEGEFLAFDSEILDPDTDQPFYNNATNGLTSYGETVLFNLTTAIIELQTYLRDSIVPHPDPDSEATDD